MGSEVEPRRGNAVPSAAIRAPKPYPGFPLFAHAKGYWCKKVGGRQQSFGAWAWPDRVAYERSWKAALAALHKRQEDEAHGRLHAAKPEQIQVGELVEAYVVHQHARTQGKVPDIKAASFSDLRRSLMDFRDFVGPSTSIADLERFDPLRQADNLIVQYVTAMRAKYGWYAFNKRMSLVVSFWSWAEHPVTGVLGRPFRLKVLLAQLGDTLRSREKRERQDEFGKQRWTPDELRAWFAFAPQPLRAMLRLMYFCAYGNSDCADIPTSAIEFEPDDELELPEGWGLIHFPRPKTEIERAAVAPKELLDDLREAIALRPSPADERWEGLAFLTRYGNPWVRDIGHADPDAPERLGWTVNVDTLSHEFRRLRDSLARCPDHGWFTGRIRRGSGYRSDLKREARTQQRPSAPAVCPRCRKKTVPMRRLPLYTFRHTAITYASGAADADAQSLFEGHAIPGVRRRYVEEVETHKLKLIADRLMEKLNSVNRRQSHPTTATVPTPPLAASTAAEGGAAADSTADSRGEAIQTPGRDGV